MTTLGPALEAAAGAVEDALSNLLPNAAGLPYGRLVEAMRYASLGGGKRLRPFLVLQCAGLFGVGAAGAVRAAAAVEMTHCYSLAHDDLPAMDDDATRRGRPSTHAAFDEATAILAGDCLLTLAFEVLADPATHADAEVRASLALTLARAAGCHGMAGGQAMDLDAAAGRAPGLAGVVDLQRRKTGALIGASCEIGALIGGAGPDGRRALADYARAFGLAFQIADDLLDLEGDAEALGKATGKDAGAGKATLVSLLGPARARARAEALAREAAAALAGFGPRADLLRAAAGFAVSRRY